MRTLDYIKDDSDIYQATAEIDILYVEKELSITFPESLKNIYRQPDLELLKVLPTFLWPVHHDSVGIIEVNKRLQQYDEDPYPVYLVAFATNECGDFWVINSIDYSVTYIDPDKNIDENLSDKELFFKSFDKWLQRKTAGKLT